MMMITDIGHAAFAAHDLERALAFYDKLGIRESFRLNREDGSLMLIYLHVAGDRFIEVFPGGPTPDPSRKGSFMHLCLLTDDMQATVEQLRQADIAIDREPKVGLDGNWQAWIRDPDGNAIELMQLSEDSAQRQAARATQK
jgi:lactoylglutathione lyase